MIKVNKIEIVKDTEGLKTLRNIIRGKPVTKKPKLNKKIKYKFIKR